MYAQNASGMANTGHGAGVPNPNHHPDFDMELYYAMDTNCTVYVYHNRPFQKELSWLEYNLDTDSLDFIMDDGDIRNFGIAVDKSYGAYLQNNHCVAVILQNAEGQPVSGESVPLIVHRN